MSEEILEKAPFASFDHQSFYLDGKPFFPMIFEEEVLPPKGFNSVLIRLPAGIHEDLLWDEKLSFAEELMEKGYYILWELDFNWDKISFTDKQASLSLKIACDEFSRIYPRFEKASIGMVLYQGTIGIDLDSLINFITVLAPSLPDLLPIVLAFEGDRSEVELLKLLHKDNLEHFLIAFKGTLPISALAWQRGASSLGYLGKDQPSPYLEKKIGVIYSSNHNEMELILNKLDKPYKVLYENFATEEWDGLDLIISVEKEPSTKVQRILRGFEAAGGEVIRGRGI
ncbi:MAG TPA: hypothetical protein VLG44_07925 [Chlamydiales bacterium]|nr:hypothetical protein [Chlamydiales bacterium]